MATAVEDLEQRRADKRVRELDDETLVFAMLGMLAASYDGAPMFGGQTKDGALYTRRLFTEVAERWIPADVFGLAFNELMGEADDA
jgi:hypothetical protein